MWERVQALHRRAQVTVADRQHLSPAAAAVGYDNAIISVLGQFTAISDQHRMRFFDHLLDAIAKSRSFEGLATPFLSCLNTAGLLHDKQRVGRATALWKQFGATAAQGPKLIRGFLIDTGAKTFTPISANALNQLAPHGVKASLMTDGSIKNLAVQIVQAGLLDQGVAADGDTCKGAAKLICGIVGAVIGGGLSEGTGAVAGFGAGVAVGDILGDLGCGHSSASQSQAGAGGASSRGDTTGPDAGPTSTETGPTESGPNSSEPNQSIDNTDQSTSGPDSTQNDNTGSGGGNTTGGGLPNPDDPHGFPSPEDPKGSVAHSPTYLLNADAGAVAARNAAGVWTLSGVPQLSANLNLQTAGLLGTIPGLGATRGLAGSAHLVDAAGLSATVVSTSAVLTSTVATSKLPNPAAIAGHE
jgi:hypothetical protein